LWHAADVFDAIHATRQATQVPWEREVWVVAWGSRLWCLRHLCVVRQFTQGEVDTVESINHLLTTTDGLESIHVLGRGTQILREVIIDRALWSSFWLWFGFGFRFRGHLPLLLVDLRGEALPQRRRVYASSYAPARFSWGGCRDTVSPNT
jgi:hypothetical protein